VPNISFSFSFFLFGGEALERGVPLHHKMFVKPTGVLGSYQAKRNRKRKNENENVQVREANRGPWELSQTAEHV